MSREPLPEISAQLEREKFQSDLAQVSNKDVSLLRTLAATEQDELSPTPFAKQFQHEYFGRLTDRGLLIRAGRGRYNLYHPLFASFCDKHNEPEQLQKRKRSCRDAAASGPPRPERFLFPLGAVHRAKSIPLALRPLTLPFDALPPLLIHSLSTHRQKA